MVFFIPMLVMLSSLPALSQQNTGITGLSKLRFSAGLLPVPQHVLLADDIFVLNDNWSIAASANISSADPAVVSLNEQLKERFGIRMQRTIAGTLNSIQLTVKPGSVKIGQSIDTNRAELERQAYRLKLEKGHIRITANASAGLFYAVQTLVQLLQSEKGKIYFASGEITDWPVMNLRMIYWDDAHHLERLDAMKRAIRQASFYKINAFALKLEGHFKFKSAKEIVEPYAYSARDYQELTSYANAHYVQLVPYIDAPAHISFILKHPVYQKLRAFQNSNYELNVSDPKGDEVILGMFEDLISANKGGKYILFSTDEAYYVGKSKSEKMLAKQMGGNGKLLAAYITRIANKLHAKGRKIIIWAEYPLTVDDISSLPSYIINGVYNEKWASKIKENGMRQLIYTSIQGVEPLFPNYHKLPSPPLTTPSKTVAITDDEAQQGDLLNGRVGELLKDVHNAVAARNADLMGVVVAGWGDAGLNPETFWLGYACGGAAAWNNTETGPDELSNRFYNSFYGSAHIRMDRVYQLLSTQAGFWDKSWDWQPSKLRSPIFGNSYGIFDTARLAKDQTLPLLPVPSKVDLTLTSDWKKLNQERLQAARKYLHENDELMKLLHQNMLQVNYQHYNLQVLYSIAKLCRQNLDMLLDLEKIYNQLSLASDLAPNHPTAAVSMLDVALNFVKEIRDDRNGVLQLVSTTWLQDWYPRVAEANGRKFVDQVDDVKDHQPVRTVDMSYLIYRQLHFPLGHWAENMLQARNDFAAKNGLPQLKEQLDWKTIY